MVTVVSKDGTVYKEDDIVVVPEHICKELAERLEKTEEMSCGR